MSVHHALTYTLRFFPLQNYIEVDATYPVRGESHVELMMAVWTPGSYMVREYARNVEDLQARDAKGQACAISKVRKNRWRVATAGLDVLHLQYRVYCREMTVRTNWVDGDFALLNGAPTFITWAGHLDLPHDVRLEKPAHWPHVVTALPAHPSGAAEHFRASNFDHLVDSPWMLGNLGLYEFSVQNKKHIVANEGEGGIWDGPRAAADVEKIVQQNVTLWGELPYVTYVFMNLLTDGRGGLEHKDSTVLMASRWAARQRSEYVDWLGLVSHEFFHVWNIKRLRPRELGPFDYENEVPTRSLWVAEGFTAYYDDLQVHRAGLSTQKEYLERLSKSIDHLQSTPGRLRQSLSDASYDAWIKYYRRDENSDNSSVSYYIKGTVVAFLLDVQIRRASQGARSLNDLMRQAYKQFSGAQGFTDAQFRALASEVAGHDLSAFFSAAVDGVGELHYQDALDWLGLALQSKGPEPRPDAKVAAWLGVNTRPDGGRLMVAEVVRDGPAYHAGLNVDDEIIGIDAFRVTLNKWPERLRQYPKGSRVSLLMARRDKLLRLDVQLGEEPKKAWQLSVQSGATEAQQAQLKAWLSN